jgi:hypothetical protein
MNDWNFHRCASFLEHCIQQNPTNMEFVKAYATLIEQKTKFDMTLCSQNAEVQKNWQTNDADVAKKQIENWPKQSL